MSIKLYNHNYIVALNRNTMDQTQVLHTEGSPLPPSPNSRNSESSIGKRDNANSSRIDRKSSGILPPPPSPPIPAVILRGFTYVFFDNVNYAIVI